jgi:hypothetical protein
MSEHIKLEGFWDRVNKAVKDSGLSKSEIARRGGFERRALNGESENRMLSAGTLARFCVVTDVSADWILGIKRTKK